MVLSVNPTPVPFIPNFGRNLMPAALANAMVRASSIRAFAAGTDPDNMPPWSMRASGKRVALMVLVILAVAVVLGLLAVFVINK